MDGSFEIRLGDKVVGRAVVEKQGLYYHFSCRCPLSGEAVQRIAVSCDGKRVDLGVLVPMNGQFGIEKRVPCKRLGEGTPEFRLVTKAEQEHQKGKFVPVYPEEPFSYIRNLEHAFLSRRDGQIGIVIQEKDG